MSITFIFVMAFLIVTVGHLVLFAFISRSHRRKIHLLTASLATLEEDHRTLKAVFDTVPIAIIRLDIQGRVTLWSRAAERIFGWKQEELLGGYLPIIPPEDQEVYRTRFAQQFTGGFTKGVEVVRLRNDGTRIETHLWTAPILDSTGQAIGVVGCLADITERKAVERELKAAKAEAESANAAKSIFLASLSHELRTPLTAILGFSEFLSNPHLLLARRDQYLEAIHRNALQLNSLVEDVLDLASIEAKKIKIEPVRFSVASLIDDISTVLEIRAQLKGVKFSVEIKSHIPDAVHTDPTRLRQILLNVAGNAIKFVEKGYVRVEVYCDESQRRLTFRVVDNGPGISEAERSHIFEPFVQGGQTASSRSAGVGLGLSLSRQLARALGGDLILLESKLGEGSTFEGWVECGELIADRTLSATGEGETTELASSTSSGGYLLEGMRILLVEDNQDLRELLCEVLCASGATVELAVDGVEGVEKATSTTWDLILMDIQMPRMDGYEATRTLRRQGYTLPIFALTANAMPDQKRLCLEAGCNLHIKKPLRIADLVSAITRMVSVP